MFCFSWTKEEKFALKGRKAKRRRRRKGRPLSRSSLWRDARIKGRERLSFPQPARPAFGAFEDLDEKRPGPNPATLASNPACLSVFLICISHNLSGSLDASAESEPESESPGMTM